MEDDGLTKSAKEVTWQKLDDILGNQWFIGWCHYIRQKGEEASPAEVVQAGRTHKG